VGASVRFGKRAHLYAEIEKSFAAKVTTAWQWNAGLWYDF
jgi:outer membrane autotransporter protein